MNNRSSKLEYDKIVQEMKENPASFLSVGESALANYLIVCVEDSLFAIDINCPKSDIKPIDYLKVAQRLESGLYVLKGQERRLYGTGKIDHTILPVYLAGALNMGETINPETAHYILPKRSLTEIPQFITDKKTGEKKEINFSLALIVNGRPGLGYIREEDIKNTHSPYHPKLIFCKDASIPVIEINPFLIDFADTFCKLYPELSEYYPFSKDFKFKE